MENVTEDTVALNSVNEDYKIVDEEEVTSKQKSAKVHPYQVVADTVAEMTYNSRNKVDIAKWMTDVLRTICAINALPEYATGIRVRDVHYQFNEYELPKVLSSLIVPAKVVLTDVPSARDYYDRNQFKVGFGKVLTPDEVAIDLRNIANKSRLTWDYVQVSRPKVGLLTGEIESAVFAGKVTSEKLDHITYLTAKFDDEAQVDVFRWARMFGARINEH